MKMKPFLLSMSLLYALLTGCHTKDEIRLLNRHGIATTHFGNDADWFENNIPFFDSPDTLLNKVYYYRWKLFKAHLRQTGNNGFVVTEFINHVPWDREPFCTINAASMHHIHEGRWLKDERYLNGYIDYLFGQGGNDRRYSESIADAAYQYYLVQGNSKSITKHLDSMVQSFQGWSDHYDSTKKLYWIPAMPDATEYTIASIDASGGTAGFDHGEAFRPTINSYQYANALAISRIAEMKGEVSTAKTFRQTADALKYRIQSDLWNPSLEHFTDRFKQENQFVHYWDFIRGRELAGLIPWYFNLPDDSQLLGVAWKHALDTNGLMGRFGYRTNEPSYEHYFKQFVWFEGQRGSQWNGPSWPYQSSLVLTAMSNLLHQYRQHTVKRSDFMHVLKSYANQHVLPNGDLNLVENYDPNLGGPIVYYYWSNHYNHSSFNDLIISGLCGLIPSEGDTLAIDPLADASIPYFCLDGISYHGRKLSFLYDQDGSRYGKGKGLMAYVDGKKVVVDSTNGKFRIPIGKIREHSPSPLPENKALNISRKGYPQPSASVQTQDTTLFQAIDGRSWYFPEITNRWTTLGSTKQSDWYGLDFGKGEDINEIRIHLLTNGKGLTLPDAIHVEYEHDGRWQQVNETLHQPSKLLGNTINTIRFKPIQTRRIRVVFHHPKGAVAMTEMECLLSK